MKLRQHEIDETINMFDNEKLFRKDICRYIVGNSIVLALAGVLSKFSIIFLIIELIFIGVTTWCDIYLKNSAKEKKSACAFYQVLKWCTFSVSILLVSINAILLLDSSIIGIIVVTAVIVAFGLTLFNSVRTVRADKNKELQIKEDPYRFWRSAGTSLGLIGVWLARGLISNLSQEQAIILVILGSIYVSFAKIPEAKRAYRLYLEWSKD